MADYTQITDPYNNSLAREPGGLSFASGGQNTESEVTQQTQSAPQAGGTTAASSSAGGGPAQQASVASGGAIADITIENSIQSKNWSPKKVGFMINGQTGYAEFTDVYVSGDIQALTGTIGGWTINATTLTGGNATLGSTGVLTLGTTNDVVVASAADATYRLWVGNAVAASAPFSVTKAGALNATGATITGSITATTGTIGGWVVDATSLKDAAGTVGMSSSVTAGDDIRFWAGDVTPGSAEFQVAESGALTASSATITGSITATSGSIGSFTIGTYLYTGTKLAYNDTNAGVHIGSDGIGIGNNIFTVSSVGALVATSATITGAVTATSGSIGSFTIGTYLYTGSKTAYNDSNIGVHIGGDGIGIGNNVFTVSSVGALTATSATITGAITATTGAIGGWVVTAADIKDAAGTVGMSSTVTAGDDIRFFAGNVTPASAPFRVTEAGALTATSATITGAVTISSGSGIANLTDAGALATLDMIDVNTNAITNGAGWTDDTVANLKRRNFTAEPTTPYNVGDLWSGLSAGDLKVCTTQRLTGAYTAGDWVLASKYTDDSGVTTIVGNTVTTGFVNALNVTAASMNVGGLLAGTIASQSIVLGITAGTGDVEIRAGIATGDFANAGAASGFIIGLDDSDSDKAKLYFGDPTTYLKWDGAGLTVAGALTATVGSSIGSSYLSGAIPQANLNIADRGWSQTSAFSVTDADTVAWGAGTFTSADGTAYSIDAGNTGNMVAKTYVYLDIAISTTVYQTTTTAATAVGVGKVLVATAQNNTTEAVFTVLSGQGTTNIDAANIVAGSITVNEIASTTITAAKMNVSTLSSIVADMGAITAGTITLDSSGNIKSGQTDYETGTGWFVGYSGGTSKLSMGSSTNYIKWDGTYLKLKGSFDVGTGGLINNSSYTVANLPVAPTSTSFLVPSAYEKVNIKVWGSGGSGGSRAGGTGGATGGGGAAYSEVTAYEVVAGTGYTITVPAGGVGVAGNSNGNAGGTSSFGAVCVAVGGAAGIADSSANDTAAGGSSASGTGDIKTSGGSSTTSVGNEFAGGGGSGGDTTDGGNATTSSGGAAGTTNGAGGGAGTNNGASGTGGVGAGGGGSLSNPGVSGAGGDGQVIIKAPLGTIKSATGGTHTTDASYDYWTFSASGTWTPASGVTTPGNAYASDNAYATLPAASGALTVDISKDAGANYHTALSKTFTGSDSLLTYGDGSTELWGSSFTRADMVDGLFRVRIAQGDNCEVYKTFGFTTGTETLTGIEIAIEANWNTPTLSIDLVKVKIYYGTSILPVQAGSFAYASNGRKDAEGAGAGTGVLVYYDGTAWRNPATGASVAA